MHRLGVLRQIVPEHGRVVGASQVSFRVSLLGVNKVRKLGRVSQEEDGGVVGDPVKVALGRPKLDRETSRVTRRVGTAGFTTDGGESNGDGALGTLFKHGGETEVVHVVGTDKLAVRAGSLGCEW